MSDPLPSDLGRSGQMTLSDDGGTSREFATAGPVKLSIEAGAGEVRVNASATDRTTVTLAPPHTADDTARELIARTTIEQRGDRVVVKVPRRGVGFLRRSPELAITVAVPAGSSLDASTDSADVRTTGRLEHVRSKCGSGDVLVEHVAEAHLQTGSGDSGIDRADGSVRVQSGSGDVSIRRAAGGSVSTGSGDVRVEACDGPLQVNSGSGDVGIDEAGADISVNTASGDHHIGRVRRGQVTLNSASGDIHVGLLDGTPVWLEVTSLTGSVHSALEGGEPPVDGEDSVSLRINTVSGDVSLARA